MIAQAVKHMLAAGMPHDAIVAAIADMEACVTPTRSKGAERQARYEERKRQKASESVRNDASDETSSPQVSPNDIYSNPHPNPTTSPSIDFAGKVLEEWNAGPAKAGATPAKSMDATRRRSLKARVADHGEAAVLQAIRNLAASPWHCGSGGWRADITWLLKSPGNFQKALEMESAAAPPSAADSLIEQSSRYRRAA